MKVLIFGASGMLGNTLFRHFSKNHQVTGTCRKSPWHENIISDVSVDETAKIEKILDDQQPDLVLNCIGVIKQVQNGVSNEQMIRVNALWPHELARLCKRYNSQMIHFSTDCVFTGKEGGYKEDDFADSRDLYGLTKYLGEVRDQHHVLTLRTSIIGHEVNSNVSLIDWFLSQDNQCKGFSKAIYSGFPTIAVAKLIESTILPAIQNKKLYGLYHFSTEPIDKYSLLNLVAKVYSKNIAIEKSDELKIDRSLNSERFREDFKFEPKSWQEYVEMMYEDYQELRDTL